MSRRAGECLPARRRLVRRCGRGSPHAHGGRKVADEALRRRPDLKVLFTTGYTRNAIVHHGRLDEGVNLITKPFTAQSLALKIQHVLENS